MSAQIKTEPAIGSRFLYEKLAVAQPMTRDADGDWVLVKTGATRVWELVASVPLAGLVHRHNPLRAGTDRHTIRCVKESGFNKQDAVGIGHETRVSDSWFEKDTIARIW